MNVVSGPQLTFQMLASLQKYLYRQSQYSKTWGSKYLALIAQMVTALRMNPKAGLESPSGRDIFGLKNFDTFLRISVRESKMMLMPAHGLHFKC